MAKPQKAKASTPRRTYLPFVIIAAVLVVIVSILIFFSSSKSDRSASVNRGASPPNSSPVASARNEPAGANRPSGIVVIEEFGDYQCPPCGQLHPELKKIQKDYGGRISFTFYNFPLTTMHKNAWAAAQAAEAARLQDHFEPMHDLLYENQNDWKDAADPQPAFTKYARKLGLDLNRFATDMTGQEVQERISADRQHGASLGVVGTPTLFLDGRELKTELTNGEGIRKAIDMLLARKANH